MNEEDILFLDTIYVKENLSKEEFFNRSKVWLANKFKDGKEVEQYHDKESGLIIGKGTLELVDALSILGGHDQYLRFTVNIYVKEGRARFVIDNISFVMYEGLRKTMDNELESYYFDKKGRVWDKKHKLKNKWSNYLQRIISTWVESMDSKSSYSDF